MSSVRKRKKTKKNNVNKPARKHVNKSNKSQNVKKSVNKQVPVIPLPLLFRLLIVSMFLFSIYAFKLYYLPKTPSKTANSVSSTLDNNEIDYTQIINSDDLDLNATKLKEISPRFSKKKKKTIPSLRLWNIYDFWTKKTALNISNQLYHEFMDETKRNQSFYFAINQGNEKIRGNDNILAKTQAAHDLLSRNAFSYCKYEYRRQLPLYQRILSYLNSSYVTNLMSTVLKQDIIGVSDLFISVYYKDNFLSTHNDRGLGHYAFVNFLSQNWDSDENGGALNFNCQDKYKWRESCYELKPKFNQKFLFKVWPDSVSHFVKEVTVDKPRIAITGWYFTSNPKGVHWASIQEETGYGLK